MAGQQWTYEPRVGRIDEDFEVTGTAKPLVAIGRGARLGRAIGQVANVRRCAFSRLRSLESGRQSSG